MPENKLKLDEIGRWSEIKLEIIEKYVAAYSLILSKQKLPLKHSYIDGFAGAGVHKSKASGLLVPGSPAIALKTEPPFQDYHFVDLDQAKVTELRELAKKHPNAHVHEDDANKFLLGLIPTIRYDQYKRALCVLDPYGLDLDWKVIETAGKIGTVEIFLNFPVMDMNRNVFWKNWKAVSSEDVKRMNRFWGDESWRTVAYKPQEDFFEEQQIRTDNDTIADAFRQRLETTAGFKYIPNPLPMKNAQNAIVYYLYFASPNKTGAGIVKQIFDKYRKG